MNSDKTFSSTPVGLSSLLVDALCSFIGKDNSHAKMLEAYYI